jgi:CRISPR-associated protein Csd2
MSTAVSTLPSITQRCEIVLLFDVIHGNPNGDPDAGNAPRSDPETGFGFVTDVCLKRKIRNFVAMTQGNQPPNKIYVKERGILANEQRRAYLEIGAEPDDKPNFKAREWMCKNFFDVRTFGAVMSTGKAPVEEEEGQGKNKGGKKNVKLWNCGQVRGPVQLGFARSVNPIFSMEHTITRVALTNAGDTGKSAGEEGDEKAATGQFGRKHTVPYGLYSAHIFISPFLAKDTGFSGDDFDLLLQALEHLFDHDRSASRGEMSVRGLYVFQHDSALGNAPAHTLFDLIEVSGPPTARSFQEYSVRIPEPTSLPAGVQLRRLIG